MTRWSAIVASVLALLVWPASVGAFSFLPGGFAPGEQILSVQLGAGSVSTPTVTFDTATDTLVFDADVTTITTNLATYNIPLGDVVFQSTVMLVTENIIPPVAPFFGGQLSGTFTNGLAADLSIIDVAGIGTLLDGEYIGSLLMNASPGSFGLPVSGSLNGDFSISGGDANFLAAFGSQGNYFANLANFLSDGSPVGNDLCNLVTPQFGSQSCPSDESGGEIDDFTVNPAGTIVPVAVVPEPALAWLLVAAALCWGTVRRARA